MPPKGLFDLYGQSLGQEAPDEVMFVPEDGPASPDQEAQKNLAREALLKAAQQRAEASEAWQKAVKEKNEETSETTNGGEGGSSY